MSLKLLTCYRTTTKQRIAVAEAFGSEDGKPFSLELIDEDGKPLSLDGLTVSKNGKFVLRNGDLRFTITNSFDDHLVLVDAPKQRLSRARFAHALLADTVRLLPSSKRDRYLEEFRAELLELPRNMRLRHALSLFRGALVLRLRGDAKNKTADAAVRRAKD
jgi:hypothetical protein